MNVRYATREDVKRALDSAETARDNARVDAALDGATDSIHGLCHRRFYPELATRTFDWPDRVQRNLSWRVWLDANEVISLNTLVSGGVTIPVGDYLLYPSSGPPYNRIEINLGGRSALTTAGTYQQSVAVTALFGHSNVEAPAGLLNGAVNATTGTLAVTNSAAVGVGSLLRIDSERLIVTAKTMLSTGQTLQAPGLTDRANNETVPVVNGAAYPVDETILVDAERMLVVDVAGNNLIVKRGWDGSTLAAHTAGATIFAPRTLTVQRGALGTTAASHADQAPIVEWQPPGLVHDLAVAEALLTLGQQSGGYQQEVRGGSSGRRLINNIQELRDQVVVQFGRKARSRAV